VAGANVLRRRSTAVTVPPNRTLLDTSGTGCAPPGVPSVSAVAAVLVAACDGTVARQGLDTTSPTCRCVATLEALGLPTGLDAGGASLELERCGFAVLNARRFHMKVAKADAFGTPEGRALLRLLLPLSNPALPDRHLVGVHDPKLTEPMAEALGRLGAERALVVHCAGLDELGLHAQTVGHLWDAGRVRAFHHPGAGVPLTALGSDDLRDLAARFERVFEGEPSPLADAVALNAGAGLWVAGVLPSFSEGRRWARDRLSQGVDLDEFRA
jgi:anthranilate phosphoribosyltransferase